MDKPRTDGMMLFAWFITTPLRQFHSVPLRLCIDNEERYYKRYLYTFAYKMSYKLDIQRQSDYNRHVKSTVHGMRCMMLQWYRRVDAFFGFHNDEWVQHIHLVAVRNAYIVTCMLALLIGTYQAVQNQRQNTLWVMLGLIVVSILLLVWRRLQLGKLSEVDERIQVLMSKAVRWVYLVLIAGIFGYLSYQFWILGDSFGLWFWNICIMAGPLMITLTHILKNTAQGSFWVWFTMLIIITGPVGLIFFSFIDMLIQTIRQGEALPDFMDAFAIICISVIIGGMYIVFVLGTWRSWQNMCEGNRG
ncbi:MAG: hypothetical protein GFH27_549303n104 [Chloroflexi bacterium AL-W]|nr:hypothetical protein [Chloroflexi bacterium AL-N1]NOK67989.1 hypothetical protein [Chloroflexi bacterium AL-N10]NOK73329.1 hypothetical protein [Chloroflexi bacterium AL-N5]NOK83243.1 hypothetical protein [Chloroflexi bacterium AL-W]NOK87660.1 hypothetical protein [Chloroflexi bacterium AL-N15]